jgi:hypothetical protein
LLDLTVRCDYIYYDTRKSLDGQEMGFDGRYIKGEEHGKAEGGRFVLAWGKLSEPRTGAEF